MQVKCKLKRVNGTIIDLFGQTYHFTPNAANDHVAEVTDPHALHRLVNEIPVGYELYGADADKVVLRPASMPVSTPHPFQASTDRTTEPVEPLIVKTEEGEEIDLMAMDREALAEFATKEFGITAHAKWKADTIRNKIIEAIRVAGSES